MKNSTIYITGHKNPDTDSIVSAISYAYLKQQLGQEAIAIRIGEINSETQYVLNMFNEFVPPLVKNIKTRVRDIDFDEVVTCKPTDNLETALSIMREAKKKVIGIVDDNHKLLGMATISDITNPLMPKEDLNNKCIRETPFENIVEHIKGQLIYKADKQHTNGHVHVVSTVHDTGCLDRMVITSDNVDLQRHAIESGAACLICTETEAFTDEIIQLAKEKQCNLALCTGSIYRISKDIYFATSINQLMSNDLVTFNYNDYVDDVKNIINKSRFRSYPIVDDANHLIGTLSRYHIFKHAQRNLILVDHNEMSQSIEGANQANIMEIVDHHRLGGLITQTPLFIRNQQVGCCCTIISQMFREYGIEIPKDIAGLMCCAIISDTVNFKSVTCCHEDIVQANYLAKIANLDLEKIGLEILAAGAKVSDDSHEAFHHDLKIFTLLNKKVAIAQANIVKLEDVLDRKESFKNVLKDYRKDSDSLLAIMCFTLIDGTGSYILYDCDNHNIISDIKDKGKEVGDYIFLDNVISRKQQLVPMISEILGE